MNISEIRDQYPQYQDLSDRALVNGLHKKFYSDIPYADFLRKIDFSQRVDPTADMSGMEKFRAGAGKAFYDIGRGVKQITGNAPQAEIDESKSLDAPLMNTGAGIAGNIFGNAAIIAPTALIPGANTYAGAAAIGGISGALQPTATGDSRMMNTGAGALAGMGGQALGNAAGRILKPVASRLGPEEQALASAAGREGIPLTAGQATGSRPLQITESVLENLPLTSGSQLAGREAQQRAFTAAALKRAGMTGDVAGAAELGVQKKALGQQFETIAGRNSIDFNKGSILGDLGNIQAEASRRLSNPSPITNTIDDILASAQNGVMDGAKYQGWRETLGRMASGSGTEAHYASQVKKALDSAFSSQVSSADAAAWKEASKQYGSLKTITDAMGGAGNLPAKGQIAPAQLSAALARSVGKEGKALGRGDLNELSNVGQLFVRDQVPNSGTAQRQLIQSLLTAGGGTGLGAGTAAATGNDPLQGALVGAGLTAGGLASPRLAQALMNSKAGQAYLKKGLVDLTPESRALINALTRPGAAAALTSE